MTVQPTRVARRASNLRANTVHTRVARSIPVVAVEASPPVTPDLLGVGWDYAYWTEGPEFLALGLADGGTVATWPDEMGTADAVQATEANKPLFRAALTAMGGKPVIESNGLTRHLRTVARAAVNQPVTIAVIGRCRIRKSAGAFADGHQATTKHAAAYISPSLVHVDGGDGASVSPPVNFTGEAPHLYIVEFNGASSKVWIGGRLVWTGTLAADQSEGLTLFDSAELSLGAKTLDGEEYFVGVRTTVGTIPGTLGAGEIATLATIAYDDAGCDNLQSGVALFPDCKSRSAVANDGDVTVTLTETPTAGNKIYARCTANALHAVHAVTDNLAGVGGVWTKIPDSGADQGARGVSIWEKVAVGTETDVTLTAGTGYVQIQVDEAGNAGVINEAITGDDGGGTTTTITPSITTTVNDCLILVVVQFSANATDVSWTNAFHAEEATSSRFHSAHHTGRTAGPHSSLFTCSGAGVRMLWSAVAIAPAA